MLIHKMSSIVFSRGETMTQYAILQLETVLMESFHSSIPFQIKDKILSENINLRKKKKSTFLMRSIPTKNMMIWKISIQFQILFELS